MLRKKKITGRERQGQDRIVLQGVRALLKWQSRWAGWMDRKTEEFSRRTWMALLVFFVLVSIGYNGRMVFKSLSGKEKHQLSVAPIETPGNITGSVPVDSTGAKRD